MQTLRPYQEDAVAALEVAWAARPGRGLCAMPTGSGKTHVIRELIHYVAAAQRGRPAAPILVVAHRRELMRQIYDRLSGENLPPIIMTGEADINWQPRDQPMIVITSPPWLARWHLTTRPALCICDECHHYSSNQYSTIVQRVGAEVTFGFTATPKRADGLWATNTFGPVLYAISSLDLLAQHYLADFRDVYVPTYASVPAVTAIVRSMRDSGYGRHTIVFARSIREANEVALSMQEAGINATTTNYRHSDGERTEAIEEFTSGRSPCIVNVELLTEGWDVPLADTAILMNSSQSPVKVGQMIGRVLRPHKDKVAWIYRFDHSTLRPMDCLTGPAVQGLADAMEYGLSAYEAINLRYQGQEGDVRRDWDRRYFDDWVESSWR